MPTTYYRSQQDAEVIDISFLTLDGKMRSLKLLVDSGFTGKSSFVLPVTSREVTFASLQPAQAIGAIHGQQDRAWVKCRIPELSFERTLIAIVADVSPLSLPSGVDGLAGLNFLRQFTRWGSERNGTEWKFFLAHDA